MEEEHRSEPETVLFPLLRMVEGLAMGGPENPAHATHYHVQWTVVGQNGEPGDHVHVRVVAEHRRDQELAQTLHRPMVVQIVLGQVAKHERATRSLCVQFPVAGRNGADGMLVR